jgi:coronin-7
LYLSFKLNLLYLLLFIVVVNKDHSEVIQSTSWKKDGKLLATSCKDKKLRVIDPRATSCVLEVANSHQNIKDSRVVWLGDQDRILTTGTS